MKAKIDQSAAGEIVVRAIVITAGPTERVSARNATSIVRHQKTNGLNVRTDVIDGRRVAAMAVAKIDIVIRRELKNRSQRSR